MLWKQQYYENSTLFMLHYLTARKTLSIWVVERVFSLPLRKKLVSNVLV
jgi:hypothetical protein